MGKSGPATGPARRGPYDGPWVVGLRGERLGAPSGRISPNALDLVARRETVEHGVDNSPRFARARRVVEHHRQEVLGSQRAEPEPAGGTYGGRPPDAPQQRYLAEPFPRIGPRHEPSVADDLGLP